MNLDFFAVASNLVSLFALIAVGYIVLKSGVLKAEASAHFSSLLLKVTLPCTIFVSLVSREYDPSFVRDGITIVIAGIIVFIVMLYSSKGLASVLGVPEGCVRVDLQQFGLHGLPYSTSSLGD